MADGIIGSAISGFREKEYPNRSKELRAMATLLEKAADVVDEYTQRAENNEGWAAFEIKILKKERDKLSKELEEWKEKYKKLEETYNDIIGTTEKGEKGNDNGQFR